jgi:hypothetical protein
MPPQSLSLSPGAESVASVREVSPSEVEKRTPGLEVYRYDVKVPPGHEVEFFSQLRIKMPVPGKHGDLGAAGVLRSDGTFELRLQKGETLNPDLKGKLRWDDRTEFGGVSTTSGGWIDDPIAALGPPSVSNLSRLGNKPLRLTAERKEYTVLVLLGWKRPQVPGLPSQYVYNPTALADAIEHGDFPHADVEFYLKVRLRKRQQQQWFAAAFHLGRLLLDEPNNAQWQQRRQQALKKHAAAQPRPEPGKTPPPDKDH